MKNNEYNIVNITNEKNNFSGEYTNAQKVEYSFQPENKNTIKDELNDRRTINDKVEDNVSKSYRTKEKKKERQEAETIESSTSSTTAASSAASGAAGSGAATAAGASAAAASSGGIAAVVAATTVAVVSVGAIVGVNVINPVQEVELATFLTSEISPNSIDFSFSMPSRLLMYQEDGGQDAPISEKNVVFTIANGSGFNIEEYLVEYEEYDEEHFIYYGYMGGLTPNTSYALTISIKEENPEYEKPIYLELGKRTFFTQDIPVTDDFKFETIEASTSRVNFSFVVSNTALEYTPGETDIPVVNATITSNFGYEDTISIEQLTEFDEYSMIGSGEFTGLTPSTTYTITISAELESGYKSFGYTSFTTENAVTFDTVEATHSTVNFSFIVDNEAVEYDPSLARMPAIQATISDGNDFYDEMWIEQISTYDDSNLMGSGNFTGLSANTEYTITLNVSLEQELRTLGSTSFTTSARPSSGFRWGIFTLDVEETVLFRFYVKSEYIGFVEGGPTPNCIAVVSKDGQEVKRSSDISYSDYSEYSPGACAAEGTINGLDGSTTYELTIYFVNGQSEEALGDPKEFTTKESSPTFYFEDPDTNFVVTDNSIAPVFSIKANEVEQSATSSLTNIFMEISDGVNYSDSYNVPYSEFSTGIDTSYLVYSRNHVFEGLNSGTTYTISVRNGTTDVTYGSVEVTTTGTYTGFSWGTIETTPSTASIGFNISSTYLDYESDPTAAVSSLYIDVNIGTQTVTSAGMDSLTPGTGDNLVGKATASGLTPGTTYTLTLYRIVGSDSVAIGQPKTIETDEVAFNGATIPTEVSFYSHEFTITLDFVDDPSNPQYDDLSLQFYDEPYDSENKYALGSSITLASITTEQTLLIPSNQDGDESYFEFDFDNIGSYVITANQAGVPTEVYHDDITFTDTDDPGVINGLESDYLIAVDASTGDFTLPVKLLYTDDYDKLRSFYVELCPTDGVTPSISAGASKEENYQNLTYSGTDASSVITYIQNAGADGAEFNVKIYNFDDQSNPIWESSETVNIKVADTNIVYGGSLINTDLSQDSTSVQFGISYVAPVSTPTKPQIKFIDSSDSSLIYSYDFNFEDYPTIDMINPAMSTGSTITDYASLKAAFEGKTFTVVISYYDGTTTTTKTIQTGVSFTFE